MRGSRTAATLLAAPLIWLLLAACGSSTPPPSPTPSPLPTSVLQERYLSAAGAYTDGESPVATAESQFCDPSSPSADLTRCASALSSDRQATVEFDNAIRGLLFPAPARTLVAQLLGDDARLEMLLQQAATAPSLRGVAALTSQIFDLLSATARDADAVRAAIGLPASSPSASPTATT